MASSEDPSPKKLAKSLEDADSQVSLGSPSTCTGGSSSAGSVPSRSSEGAPGIQLTFTKQDKQLLIQEGRFKCAKCEKTHPIADMCAGRFGCCTRCHNNYKALVNRWGSCRKLKTWWTNLSKEQQLAWYVKQQEIPAGAKRKFDALMYTEHDEQNTYRQTEDVDRFVPWHVFKREGLATGREVLQLEKEFQDMVDDPTVECIQRRGQWLVPFYEGVVRKTGRQHGTRSTAHRQVTVESGEHLHQLVATGITLHDQFQASFKPTQTCKEYENSNWVQGQVSDQPVTTEASSVITKAIAREACLFVSTTDTRRGFHRFALPGLSKHCAAQSKPKQMERVTSESHQSHTRVTPESRQSHTRVTLEARQSHSRVTPKSHHSHPRVTPESQQSHSRVTAESHQSHTRVTPESHQSHTRVTP